MAKGNKSDKGKTRRRLRSSYITLVISISLVLFMLGLLGMVLISAQKLADYVRERISFSVILNEDVKEPDILMLQKELDAKPYIKLTEYISSEEAAQKLEEELGEDFIDFLGYNPLRSSIDVYVRASYARADSIVFIEKELSDNPHVREVYYQESLVHLINSNVRKISLVLLVFSTLLFLISWTLINNTIRLSVYSRRFLINTMQLVGATRSFIRKPFLNRGVFHGALAALIALLLLAGTFSLVEREFIEVVSMQDIAILLGLFVMIVFTGILISYISTYFAVNKYLGLQEDQLYY